MASKQIKFQQLGELKLGDEFEDDFEAIANKKAITEAGKLMKTIGNQLNASAEARQAEKKAEEANSDQGGSRIPSPFSRFVTVVDTILEWLENSGKSMISNLKKQETILRGFFHMTELGNQANFFEILELACSFLDVPEDPFPGQREYIVKCLKDIENQKQRIFHSVEQVGKILGEIIECDEVDLLKGKQFDNVVREAHVQIDSCRRRLSGAEAAILELSTKMNTVKWFSRAFRFTGWAACCYYFHQKYQDSAISSLVFFNASALTGFVWLSLVPGRACVVYESLPKLASEHRLLREQLEDLRENLTSSKEHRDGL